MMIPMIAKITMPMPTLPSSFSFFGFLAGRGTLGCGAGCCHCGEGMRVGSFLTEGGGGVGLGVGTGDSGRGVRCWICCMGGAAGVGRVL